MTVSRVTCSTWISMLVPCLVSLASSARAEADVVVPEVVATEAVVPEPPTSSSIEPVVVCELGLELHRGRCMRREMQYAWGTDWAGVGGGLAIFGGVYVVQAISTAISTAQGQNDVRLLSYPASRLAEYERWGYVPLLGPWAKIALAPPHVDDAGATLFVIEGLLELGGVVMAIVSLFTHQEETWIEPVAVTVRVSPTIGGAMITGTF